jgi:hypothetical protein
MASKSRWMELMKTLSTGVHRRCARRRLDGVRRRDNPAVRDVEIPVKLPAALLGDALELKPPETLAALLAEWSCALDPGQLLRAARSSWFEDRSGFVWDVAAVAAVDRELIGELRTAADEETRAVAEAMLQTRAEEMLEPAPPAEAALPVLLGLAVLGTLLEGAGAKAFELRAALRSRKVWVGRAS